MFAKPQLFGVCSKCKHALKISSNEEIAVCVKCLIISFDIPDGPVAF